MNGLKKVYINFDIVFIAALLLIFAGGAAGFIISGKNTANNSGAESNLNRERELLTRIGEFEQREREYLERERERTTRENNRIERERERIKRTADQLTAIRGLDRRSGYLLQELEQEINILASYFRDSCDIIGNHPDNLGCE